MNKRTAAFLVLLAWLPWLMAADFHGIISPSTTVNNALFRADGTSGDFQTAQTVESDAGDLAVAGNLSTTGTTSFNGVESDFSGGSDGQVLTVQADASIIPETIPTQAAEGLTATMAVNGLTGGTDLTVSAGDSVVAAAASALTLVSDGGTLALDAAGDVTATGTISVAGVEIDPSGGADGQVLTVQADASVAPESIPTQITTPGSSTDDALVRFNGTGGATIQDSPLLTLTDTGLLALTGSASFSGTLDIGGTQFDLSSPTDNFVATYDVATDTVSLEALPAAAAETLATTLAAGNTTGGTDLVVSSGDALVGAAGVNTRIEAPSGQVTDMIGEVNVWHASEGALDFVQIRHTATNGSIIAVSGDLILSGATGLRLDPSAGAIDCRDTIRDADSDWTINTSGNATFVTVAVAGALSATGATTVVRAVESLTGAKSPTAAETWEHYDNQNAGSTDITITLPTPASGLVYGMTQIAAGTMAFDPGAGNAIAYAGGGLLADGVTLETGGIGTHVTLVCSGTLWLATSEAGTFVED